MSASLPTVLGSDDRVEIRLPEQKRGLLSRLTGRSADDRSFLHLPEDHRDLLFAIGDLRAWEDTHPGEVTVEAESIHASHDAVASLSSASASALGLPPDVHLTLRTDVEGTLGNPDFRLVCEWSDSGRRVVPRRDGAFLRTASGPRRVPLWMKRALDLADGFDASRPMEDHWQVLADFRRALDPDESDADVGMSRRTANLAMTAFLRGLEVRIANQFSIRPDESLGQFEIVPFSSRTLQDRGVGNDEVSERDAELEGEQLAVFQHRLLRHGARPAYALGNNSYLVVDRSSQPVLNEMARVQRADRDERKEFIRNPRAFLTGAIERHLAHQGAFEDLDRAAQEELVERTTGASFIESREYSERVTGKIVYVRPPTAIEASGTSWLPEVFAEAVAAAIEKMDATQLEALRSEMMAKQAVEPMGTVRIAEQEVEVTPERIFAVSAVLAARTQAEDEKPGEASEEEEPKSGPIILDTLDNYEGLSWHARLRPRRPTIHKKVPETILTRLRPHQEESFSWAASAWCSGLPGILNADEQGLGKTLQTISFLSWLKQHMQNSDAAERGPILVVAPTSLLRTWEGEVARHVAERKFGHVVRLYGSSLAGQKSAGARGRETTSGLPALDLDWLDEAIEDGRAHRFWFLTTYTTLANYQHSLGGIRFSALVLDEIQNIKNKDTIASKAVEAMNADFRIGLTGTPIENTTMDLWTIMDRIAPGKLGSGTEFRKRYGTPDEANMTELYARVFRPQDGRPPLALRRLKDDVATDLPTKSRLMHPRLMPPAQSAAYDEARLKLAEGGAGAALKMLHHIRSVSVHPALHDVTAPDAFVSMSARLSAVMEILGGIAARRERALVFIEHREMQFRFAELVRHSFGLNSVDIINGDTPIPRRQAIVDRFQRLLDEPDRFDLLVLGPKAAGTGLTLTAATHVIHLSRWWNPAVEEQCNDRVHRLGQLRPVTVHVPLAIHPGYREHSFDCLLQSLMQRKRRMASQALWPMGDTREDFDGLRAGLEVEGSAVATIGDGHIVHETMLALFRRDGLPESPRVAAGAYRLP
ncbi:DEAD/DEAH box helicase [Oceaniglobus roseus]|uniref:DEAD/DEAH box helicase n=1 Tax=Oceaniglobus roseus TaxID=1737570 RepID=UPI000C7EE6DC|nr:DEAD/DEAH box helicase [Kandeliimicrobium roseum]